MKIDCLIIGAGHSGILLAHKLQQKNIKTCVLEREELIGDNWRNRPDNMLLLTTRHLNSLPGLQFLGGKSGYIDRFEFAEYLGFYAEHYHVNVITEMDVVSIEREDSNFKVTTQNGLVYTAKCVVNATGVNQKPKISPLAEKLNADVAQWTLANYRKPAQLMGKQHIAVIGDGVNGRQIAEDLAGQCQVTLFCGSRKLGLPNKLFGFSIFNWLKKLGVLQADSQSALGRWWQKKQILPAFGLSNLRLKSRGVQIAKRLVDIQNNQLVDAAGKQHKVDAVIWCLGFEDDTSWCRLPGLVDESGFVCETGKINGGKTAQPGFFVATRRGLSSGASELIMGADKDTTRLANFVEHYLAKLND